MAIQAPKSILPGHTLASSILRVKHPAHLLRPRQIGSFDHLQKRGRRCLAPQQQALEQIRRQVGQSHDGAHEAVEGKVWGVPRSPLLDLVGRS